MRRFFHAGQQGGKESINPAAHVRQIHQQGVQSFQHVRLGPPMLSIEGIYRQLIERMKAVGRFDHIILPFREKAMLRAEDGSQPAGKGGGQAFQGGVEFAIYCRRVAQKPQAGRNFSLGQGAENFQPRYYWHSLFS
jgi:hypothetical protein